MGALQLFLHFALACTGNKHPDSRSASLSYQPLSPLCLTELIQRLTYEPPVPSQPVPGVWKAGFCVSSSIWRGQPESSSELPTHRDLIQRIPAFRADIQTDTILVKVQPCGTRNSASSNMSNIRNISSITKYCLSLSITANCHLTSVETALFALDVITLSLWELDIIINTLKISYIKLLKI